MENNHTGNLVIQLGNKNNMTVMKICLFWRKKEEEEEYEVEDDSTDRGVIK